ncbi:hydroxymethylglutaryl- synthase [Vairimorpha apis BRL 01]|uniref:Hydroxymethylglutaryl-synthase n=1 Tax=Vairimorpha apis BRL 01 TaxID=1037528 RepID=T0L6S6_9MICR|nr:hydroxymethylglutaryl- synthase [Vairimorpha apis BRL 01]
MSNINNIGIIGIEYQLPLYKLDESDIAKNIGWEVDKIKIGLDMQEIGAPGYSEDVVSLALSALYKLIIKFKIDTKDIGKIEVGTESSFDNAKSIKTYLLQLFSENKNISGCDSINACYGGTNAVLNTIAWMESSFCKSKYAIVICTDISVYNDGPAIPTSGAGAVAILIGKNPVYKILPETLFHYSSNEGDFLKPKSQFFPYIEGKKSVEIYKQAFQNNYENFISKFGKDFYDYIVFHSPYPKLITKICNEYEISSEKFKYSLLVSRYNGNTYTASVYFSLISLIYNKQVKVDEKICLFSFGSGCVSSIFILQKMRDGCEIDDLEKRLEKRIKIDFKTYKDIIKNMEMYNVTLKKENVDGYYISGENSFFRTYNLNK